MNLGLTLLALILWLLVAPVGVMEGWEANEGPLIRVALIQGEERKSFSVSGPFSLVNVKGDRVLSVASEEGKWEVRLLYGRPAELVYSVVAENTLNKGEAETAASHLERLGYRAVVRMVDWKPIVENQGSDEEHSFWVVLGPYSSLEEAEEVRDRLGEGFSPEVFPEVKREPWGIVELVGPRGSVPLLAENMIRLIPTDPSAPWITIYGLVVGKDFHWEHLEDRTYRGIMEFRVDLQGKLTVINELPLERYLYGVVPAEMSSSFPVEALRAQAVAARSRALARMTRQHRLESFDLSADVYSQVYAGVSWEDSVTNRVVRETRGQVLLYGDRIVNATYGGVCGGHTEDPAKIWGGSPLPYMRPIWDKNPGTPERGWPTRLDSDQGAAKWVKSRPLVYCNVHRGKIPRSLEYIKKYFRWRVSYSHTELERIIRQKTGQSIGKLLDIIPLQRGDSGRITELEIVGTRGRFRIKGELEIRKALSENCLYSTCFVVEKQMGPDGLPRRFTLVGAGWGHGVGMCQAGAAMMALTGKTYSQILNHYFPDTKLTVLY